ncbi:hypothetical protein M2324_001006 [Rhodovulum sulfidophilum]|uniref:hypothetical protein n=1 Tax=Rhodovulum sulfidophilum TaxID=35806 RepID=UPI00143ADB94|nr:hypothetical protein [Rhodovulum sulfidophilum]MCW2302622.1 hypothetical protein [Rhodovulum sulfidophilum]
MTETLHIYGPIGEGENTQPRIGAFLDDNAGVPVIAALLHKRGDGGGSPFRGQTYPTASVTGMPSAV